MNNLNETWRHVPGYDGVEVSDLGRVRNKRGKILSGTLTEKGYRRMTLRTCDGERRSEYLHRLVLKTFVGDAPTGMIARHLNGNPAENRLANLSWGTYAENSQDMLRHGTHWQVRKTHCPRNHPLVGANLVPSMRRRGRECLACSRTHNHVRCRKLDWSPDSPEFRKLSDSYFEKIEAGEESAA